MSDVARAAGVSPMTVSYTYNRPDRVSAESRDKVLRTAAALGWPQFISEYRHVVSVTSPFGRWALWRFT
ncbi:LacI family DNA-binding transcriptional regulator [Asanoa sp. NPDC050611]|uniref:LacI family DNA-binding transcriptional regulator n=1 Tax=Asanoa sp. NPDC050611 TaxID=3157098 RepID=UPI0033D96494